MKVLWFSNSPAAAYNDKVKGTGSWMEALDYAVQNCVDLHIAYLYPYKQEPFKNGFTTYHPIFRGEIIKESLKGRFMPFIHKDMTGEYLKIIREVQPDIIHIHGSENDFHNIVSKTNVPVVLSIQGNITVYAYKYLSGFHGSFLAMPQKPLSVKSLILGRGSFKKGFNWMKRLAYVEQKNLKDVKFVIGRTDWDYRITRVLSPKSKYYVCNEILRSSFYMEKWQNTFFTGKIKIHTTNGDNYYKGFEDICYALSLLNSLGYDIEWTVAGISESSTINKIAKKYLKKNYPTKGLRLLGSLDELRLCEILKSTNLYVMPSHIENSPNNLCEAMIMGVPCIATHAGGTTSILKDHKEGLIIQDGDPWAMAGAIIEMISNPQQSIRYGENARITALERHNRDSIVKSLLEIYRHIIDYKNENTIHKNA